MTRKILSLCAIAAVAVASVCAANIVNPVVDFGTGYAKEGTRAANDPTSTAGDVLTIYGHVALFQAPFEDLDASDPAVEYTFRMGSLVSQGTVTTVSGPMTFYDTGYTGGFFEIYCDSTQDADFASPATFTDGTMILSGSFSKFDVSTMSFSCAGSQNAEFVFTGGTLFYRVSDEGDGLLGVDTGLFSVCPSYVPQAIRNLGYFGLSDTKIDVHSPVSKEQISWGRIKAETPE